ncbi:MAG: hypothetical protein AB4352_16890 [Hormoscilla sp.]
MVKNGHADKIREKLCEEVSEFVIACQDRKRVDIVDEASDILYDSDMSVWAPLAMTSC